MEYRGVPPCYDWTRWLDRVELLSGRPCMWVGLSAWGRSGLGPAPLRGAGPAALAWSLGARGVPPWEHIRSGGYPPQGGSAIIVDSAATMKYAPRGVPPWGPEHTNLGNALSPGPPCLSWNSLVLQKIRFQLSPTDTLVTVPSGSIAPAGKRSGPSALAVWSGPKESRHEVSGPR